MQLISPAWFIVAGAQVVPMEWQLPQVLSVSGARMCALVPLVGRPVADVPLWQPVVQLVALVTPLCVPVAGFQAVVAWQEEHSEGVVIWVTAGVGVQLLPILAWQVEQDVAPVWLIMAGAHAV